MTDDPEPSGQLRVCSCSKPFSIVGMCCPRESKAQFLRTRLVRFGVLPSPSADVPTEPRTRMPHERPGCLFSQVLIWTARIIFFPQSWLRLSFSQIWPSGVEPSIRRGSHIVTLGEGRALRRVFHWQSAELALRWAGPTVSDTFTVRFTSVNVQNLLISSALAAVRVSDHRVKPSLITRSFACIRTQV